MRLTHGYYLDLIGWMPWLLFRLGRMDAFCFNLAQIPKWALRVFEFRIANQKNVLNVLDDMFFDTFSSELLRPSKIKAKVSKTCIRVNNMCLFDV